jgi:hypothetical protein
MLRITLNCRFIELSSLLEMGVVLSGSVALMRRDLSAVNSSLRSVAVWAKGFIRFNVVAAELAGATLHE